MLRHKYNQSSINFIKPRTHITSAVMARRRRRRPPGGHKTAAGSGGRRAPYSTDTASHTHTARSLACPLLTLSSARPFSNGIFRSDGAPASLPPASSSLTHTRRIDGFCNQNADQLGSLAGLSFPAVYVGVVECAPASPYTYYTPPPHTGFPMSAHLSRLLVFQRHLQSLGWVWVWVWDWVHTPPHTLLSFSPPSFHTISLSLAFTSA